MRSIFQSLRVVIRLFGLMDWWQWHRLLFFACGAVVLRLLRIRISKGMELPFKRLTAFGDFCHPSGLRFLVEIAADGAYSSLINAEGISAAVLYDIGANCGFFSLSCCREHPGLRAYCFEPHPDTFRILVMNIHLNKMDDRIVPVNAVVGRECGTTQISISAKSSMARVSDARSVDDRHSKSMIPLLSIDEFSRTAPAPDAIKLDVEGFEEQVLLGAKEALGNAKHLVVEVHSQELRERCRTILQDSGFMVHDHDNLLSCDRLRNEMTRRPSGDASS